MENFFEHVVAGLSARQKFLSSKYFYDECGDLIFQEIMNMPQYYLTNCELEILTEQKSSICNDLSVDGVTWDVVELGPGNAFKSKHLLGQLCRQDRLNRYYPIDISANIIRELQITLPAEIEGIDIQGLTGEYFQMIPQVQRTPSVPLFVLFLGGNIGNFEVKEMQEMLQKIFHLLQPGDRVLIGYDLKKRPSVIQHAYDDPQGITARFNLNLLRRINRELNANFIIEDFEHYCSYDPISGACRSFLVSLKDQEIAMGGSTFYFKRDECINMEISQKYDIEEIDRYTREAGFQTVNTYFDQKHWFANILLEVPR